MRVFLKKRLVEIVGILPSAGTQFRLSTLWAGTNGLCASPRKKSASGATPRDAAAGSAKKTRDVPMLMACSIRLPPQLAVGESATLLHSVSPSLLERLKREKMGVQQKYSLADG